MQDSTVNLDTGPQDETARRFTYSTRLAIYKVISHSAIMSEVFVAAG